MTGRDLLRAIDRGGRRIDFEYDAGGNVVAHRDPTLGRRAVYDYECWR